MGNKPTASLLGQLMICPTDVDELRPNLERLCYQRMASN